jgi:hypothetical protein
MPIHQQNLRTQTIMSNAPISDNQNDEEDIFPSCQFYLIPPDVAENREISTHAKLLFGLILGRSNKKGYCTSSNIILAKYRSLTKIQIKRMLKLLESHKFIFIENENLEENGGIKIYTCATFHMKRGIEC